MVIISLFSWWYTTGWLTLIRKVSQRVESVLGFFSVTILLKSLFSPFRQISAGRVNGPLNVQLQAWGDTLFSRFIGAIVRSFLIVLGLSTVALMSAVCLVIIAAWPFLPFTPLVVFVLFGGSF